MNYITTQRAAILSTAKHLRSHPTAKEIFIKVKEKLPEISFATVYRNLGYLVKRGHLKEVTFTDDAVRYDSFLRDHQHFVCQDCDKIFDLELSKLLNVESEVKKIQCHEVNYYNLELYGRCHGCKQNEVRQGPNEAITRRPGIESGGRVFSEQSVKS